MSQMIDDIRDAFWDAMSEVGLLGECSILSYTEAAQSGGYQQFGGKHTQIASGVVCKLVMQGAYEFDDWSQLPQGRGQLMLQAEQEGDVKHSDLIKITKLLGTTLTRSVTLEVVGEPVMSLLGLKMAVQIRPGGVV